MGLRNSGILRAVAKDAQAGLLGADAREVPSRQQVFIDAFAAGLAAPTMLFDAPSGYVTYDAGAGVANAWGLVGRNMIAAVKAGSQ